jgi:hypothetical protein
MRGSRTARVFAGNARAVVGVGGVGVRNFFIDAAFMSAVTNRRFAAWICWPCVTFFCAAFNLTITALIGAAELFRVARAFTVARVLRYDGVSFTPTVAAFLIGIAFTVFVCRVDVILAATCLAVAAVNKVLLALNELSDGVWFILQTTEVLVKLCLVHFAADVGGSA